MEFFSNFKSTYGKEPDYVAAQGYNIGLVIEKCINEAGTLDDSAAKPWLPVTAFRDFVPGHSVAAALRIHEDLHS